MLVNDKLRLLEVLTRIGSEGPEMSNCGICPNVGVGLNCDRIGQDWLFEACGAWPESKHPVYPVEGGASEYLRSYNVRWGISTEYGARRYRLLAWLIHKLTKEIRAEIDGRIVTS